MPTAENHLAAVILQGDKYRQKTNRQKHKKKKKRLHTSVGMLDSLVKTEVDEVKH